MNKLQWNINRNSYIFIHENALENVVCEMASILSRPQCVNELMLSSWYNIKIQILILPYVNKYVIWALMGWTLWWSDCGWYSVLKTNMYILMAWCRTVAAPVCYQWSCCDLALSRRSVDISARTYIHIRICLFLYVYVYAKVYENFYVYNVGGLYIYSCIWVIFS